MDALLPPIGGHVSTAGGVDKAIDRAEAFGFDGLQLFTQSPRAWKATEHPEEKVARFRERRVVAGITYVACHALYLINLATPDKDLCTRSQAALEASVSAADSIGADAIVLHIGSHLGAGFEPGLVRCVAPLRAALDACSEGLYLLVESSAGAGGTMGRSIAELARVVEALDGHPRLGVCLDSCHLYASGVDVGDEETVAELVSELKRTVGLERLRCLHVNDSATTLGSNRDRHANIGDGEIGARLAAFVNHPSLRTLPALLETPGADKNGPDASEAAKLRALYR